LPLEHSATGVAPDRHEVELTNRQGRARTLSYERLILATGALPVRPRIAGLDLPGVHVLHTMDDSFQVHAHVSEGPVHEAVVVGSGYVGLEMADALSHRGINVTLVGRAPAVLPTLDPELGTVLVEHLRAHGVQVHDRAAVEEIRLDGERLLVRGREGVRVAADMVIVAAGVQPKSDLAALAGASTGIRGAVRVDRCMRTNLHDVYAAGDCVETWHRMLSAPAYLPLGTTAHKQGRVAVENAVGGHRVFEGSVGTQVVKVFDLAAARTGLRDPEARKARFDPLTVATEAWDHKAYYPGAQRVYLRVTGDRRTGRLLGAQIVGPARPRWPNGSTSSRQRSSMP
jgi:NADPH-dependent 2,4-dienoyl-CoA reductase/sulfur reductase-like enzyme